MKFKMLGLALSLTAAFGLMACGDDSSSSASDNKLPEKVKTLEEALKLDCNADLKCQMVFVEEDIVKDYFYCDGKEMKAYTIADAAVCPKGEDGDDDDIPNVEKCEVKKEGDKVLVKMVADGIAEHLTLTIDAEGVITEVAKFEAKISKDDFDKACKEAKDDDDNEVLSTDCDESAKTITQTYKDEDIKNVDELEGTNELMCQMLLDPEGAIKDLAKDLEDAFGDDGDDASADEE
jgi:hypothetical protein